VPATTPSQPISKRNDIFVVFILPQSGRWHRSSAKSSFSKLPELNNPINTTQQQTLCLGPYVSCCDNNNNYNNIFLFLFVSDLLDDVLEIRVKHGRVGRFGRR
jgi:hypothetical protein